MSTDEPLGSADHIPVVVDIEQGTVSGWLQVTLSDGSFFMLPAEVVYANGWEQPGTPVAPERATGLEQAAWQRLVENRAMDSLARAEQCRLHLEHKLVSKGLPAAVVREVLDDLQQRGLLSDRRYAEGWARNRMLRRGEGPKVVQLGLRARGVPADIAAQAVQTVLQEQPDLLEHSLERAAARLARTRAGHDPAALRYRLLGEGFSAEMVDIELKKYLI